MNTRPSVGEWVAAAAGLAILVSLLFPWERHPPVGKPPVGETLSGWASFGPLAAALVLAAAVPMWHLGRRLLGHRGLPALASVSAGAAAVFVVIVGIGTRIGVSERPAGGLYAGLVAAAVLVVGSAVRLWLTPDPPRPSDPPA